MTKISPTELRALLERVTRLAAAGAWNHHINPTQLAALDYLSRANRFSRAPSHVSDYLGATRGTVSQTLKTLERKGFLTETRSTVDKRRTSYNVTGTGVEVVHDKQDVLEVLEDIPSDTRAGLEAGLRSVLRGLLKQRQGRSFGICRTCKHHQPGSNGAYCRLLKADLTSDEPDQICQEHAA